MYSKEYTIVLYSSPSRDVHFVQYSIYSSVGIEYCTAPLQKSTVQHRQYCMCWTLYSSAAKDVQYSIYCWYCTVQFNYKRFTVLYRIYGRSCTVLRQEMYSTEYTVGIVHFTTRETVQKILTVLFSSPAKAAQYRNSTYFLFLNEKHVNRHLKIKTIIFRTRWQFLYNQISFLQMKYFLFAGKNATGTDDKKCAKQFK